MDIKKLVKKTTRKLGFEIQCYHERQNFSPVEFSKEENFIVDHVLSKNLTMGSAQRCYSTILACKYVIDNSILGDFVECGVWRGGHAIIAAYLFKHYNQDRNIYLYDTFAGMTEPTSVDFKNHSLITDTIDVFRKKQKNNYNEWCYADINEVRKEFSEIDILGENVFFVKGDVASTLTQISNLPKTISVLRLDTDWYESTKIELNTLYPLLSSGGVLTIDDYGYWHGSKKAVDEYFIYNGQRPFFQYVDYTARCGIKV